MYLNIPEFLGIRKNVAYLELGAFKCIPSPIIFLIP